MSVVLKDTKDSAVDFFREIDFVVCFMLDKIASH